VHRRQEPADVPGAGPRGIQGQDGLGKLEGDAAAAGDELGVKVPLPHPGHPEVRKNAALGEEVPGVVTVALGGVAFPVELPFLQHELFHKGLDEVLELLEEPL